MMQDMFGKTAVVAAGVVSLIFSMYGGGFFLTFLVRPLGGGAEG